MIYKNTCVFSGVCMNTHQITRRRLTMITNPWFAPKKPSGWSWRWWLCWHDTHTHNRTRVHVNGKNHQWHPEAGRRRQQGGPRQAHGLDRVRRHSGRRRCARSVDRRRLCQFWTFGPWSQTPQKNEYTLRRIGGRQVLLWPLQMQEMYYYCAGPSTPSSTGCAGSNTPSVHTHSHIGKRKWTTGFAYKDSYQKCKKCKIKMLAFQFDKKKTRVDYHVKKKPSPHLAHLCQRCKTEPGRSILPNLYRSSTSPTLDT